MTANTTTDRTVSTNDRATFRDLKRRLVVNGLYIFPNPSSRDSPEDSQTGANIDVFSTFLQGRRKVWTAAATLETTRTLVEGLIWLFSLAFGRTPPVGSS
jgi:hypothetical protein